MSKELLKSLPQAKYTPSSAEMDAMIKLGMADLRIPQVLIRVTARVVQELHLHQHYASACRLDWKRVGAAYRRYTGTKKLPSNLRDALTRALDTVINVRRHRISLAQARLYGWSSTAPARWRNVELEPGEAFDPYHAKQLAFSQYISEVWNVHCFYTLDRRTEVDLTSQGTVYALYLNYKNWCHHRRKLGTFQVYDPRTGVLHLLIQATENPNYKDIGVRAMWVTYLHKEKIKDNGFKVYGRTYTKFKVLRTSGLAVHEPSEIRTHQLRLLSKEEIANLDKRAEPLWRKE